MLQHRDVRMGLDLGFQRGLHGMAGGVGGMDDAAVAVAAFAGEVIADVAGCVPGERHALADQPFDGLASVLDHVAGDLGVAQAGAGDLGVVDVILRRCRPWRARRRSRPGPSCEAPSRSSRLVMMPTFR